MVDQPERTPAQRITQPVGGLDEPEQELWQGGYSAKAMVGQWILAGLVSIAAAVGAVLLPDPMLKMAVGAVAILFWVILFFKYLVHRLGEHYRLTSQRFFHQEGLLSRKTDRIEVIDMDDITFKQGPIERMLGVGSILISSSDKTSPELLLKGIDNVQTVADLLDKARRAERRKRSVQVEQI